MPLAVEASLNDMTDDTCQESLMVHIISLVGRLWAILDHVYNCSYIKDLIRVVIWPVHPPTSISRFVDRKRDYWDDRPLDHALMLSLCFVPHHVAFICLGRPFGHVRPIQGCHIGIYLANNSHTEPQMLQVSTLLEGP